MLISTFSHHSPYLAEIKSLSQLQKTDLIPPDCIGFTLSANHIELVDQNDEDLVQVARSRKARYIGYFPRHPFIGYIAVDRVLSGDGELLDMRLELQIAVEEPQLFFEKILLIERQIPKNDYFLKTSDYADEIALFLRQYEASDIINARLSSELEAFIKQGFSKHLRNNGLRLISIRGISVWRSSERTTVMTKIASNLGSFYTPDDLNVFLQNESLQDKVSVQQLGMNDVAEGQSDWFESLKTFFTTEESGRNYRMKKILNSIKTKIGQGPTKVKPKWWISTITWVLLSLASGIGMTMLILGKDQTLKLWKVSVLAVNWLAILTFVFYRIRWLVRKIKKVKQNAEAIEPTDLNILAEDGISKMKQSNKIEVNRRVREQVANELRHQKDVLEGLRTKAYKAGFEELALYIHQLLKVVDDKTNLVLNPTYAEPVYLQNTHKLTSENWKTLLDAEETLLIKAALLSQEVERAGTGKSSVEDEKSSLAEYEELLNAFMNDFVTRARLIQK